MDTAEAMLLEYFQMENDILKSSVMVPEAVTGLSANFATSLVKSFHLHVDYRSLCSSFPGISESYMQNISAILENVHAFV